MALNQILNSCQVVDYLIIDETGDLGIGNCKNHDEPIYFIVRVRGIELFVIKFINLY